MEQEETNDHLLLHCTFVDVLWGLILRWAGCLWVRPRTLEELWALWPGLIDTNKKPVKEMWLSLLAAVLWSIWLQRNATIFRQVTLSHQRVYRTIFGHWQNWIRSSDSQFAYTANQMVHYAEWLHRWG